MPPERERPVAAFSRRWRLGALSLRWRLVALVLATILPLLAFGLGREYVYYQETRQEAGARALALARSASLVVEHELQVRIAALEVLALSGLLQEGNIAAFRVRAEAVVANLFPGANILLLDRNGRQLMNLATAPGATLQAHHFMETSSEVFAAGRPGVSRVFDAPVLKRPAVSIEVPVKAADGSVLYALALIPDLAIFSQTIEEQRPPAGWIVSVLDTEGTHLARSPRSAQFVGVKATQRTLTHVMSRQEGVVEMVSLEGIKLLSAFSHTRSFGWAVTIGVPRAELTAPAWQSVVRELTAGAAALAIGIFLAVLIARRISGPIGSLRRLAGELRAGDLDVAPATGLRETDEVARTLYEVERGRRQSAEDEGKAQRALRASEEQLRRSQKLDAIGQLTGGIAHDFNNILTVIMGTSELLVETAPDNALVVANAETILRAGARGASLVAQLLAFARMQTLQPASTDVNTLVRDVARLLRPTLGAAIEIRVALEADAWPALVDPSQLSTALLNLAVNARDAMPDGGRLTFETANVILDEIDAKANSEIATGPYVMITVSDSGSGIPGEIHDKIFDPFFTTKEAGRGTGLGLSMVYGFVRQSGGHLKLYSKVGVGTSLHLYLPRSAGHVAEAAPVAAAPVLEGGDETILVVEDDAMVRMHVVSLLTGLGYRPIVATDGRTALAIVEAGEPFDVLFTDIVMPGGMNGRQLADEILRRRGSVRVLFTSGYTENAILHHGPLGPGVAMLDKPYRKGDLARKLREVLTGPPRTEPIAEAPA